MTFKNLLCYITLCFVIIGMVQPQVISKVENSDTPHMNIEMDKNLDSEECLAQMRGIFQPEQGSTLLSMFMYSGKGINQLGDYDQCNLKNDLEYVLLSVQANGQSIIRFGICGPKSCSDESNYSKMTAMITEAVKTIPTYKDADIVTKSEVPAEVNSASLSTGSWVVIMIMISIWILWLAGLLIQYTKIGDIRQNDQGSSENIKIEDRKSKLALFFYAWSPAANLTKLFTVKENADQTLTSLNGVRVLSICWVIVGHGFGFVFFAPVLNIATVMNIVNEPLFGVIPGGFYAVDSFFFLAGFLSFYLLCSKMYPKRGGGNWGLIYFHRYYRLIFPVVFMTLFAYYIMPYMGDGPFYKESWAALNKACDKYWWTNFLFINNLYPWDMGKECIGWVWYLANDFQFFLLTPPLVYLFCKKRVAGYISVGLFILASVLTNGIVSAHKNYSITLSGGDGQGMTLLYSKPWGRMGPYFVGGLIGLAYFEYAFRTKFPEFSKTVGTSIFSMLKNSRITSLIFLLVGFGITASMVFPLKTYYVDCENGQVNCWSTFGSSLYNAVCRPFFVLGLGLCVMPCFVGRLRAIQGFLGNEVFAVLARLNYMVYMNHCLVLFWIISDQRQASYVNFVNQWYFSIGCMVLSFIFAIPMTLMFEVPFMNIEKTLLFPPRKRVLENGVHHQANGKNGAHYEPLKDEDETFDTQLKDKLLKQ